MLHQWYPLARRKRSEIVHTGTDGRPASLQIIAYAIIFFSSPVMFVSHPHAARFFLPMDTCNTLGIHEN